MKGGPALGSRYADFITMFQFLQRFEKAPLNIHKIQHGRPHFGDSKKVYRYLRYAMDLNFLEIAHIDVDTPRRPGYAIIYYQLTEDGRRLLTLAKDLRVLGVFVSPEKYVRTEKRGRWPSKPKREKPWIIQLE